MVNRVNDRWNVTTKRYELNSFHSNTKRKKQEDWTCILPIVNRVWRKHACKLPHCAIDPDVAFWHDYLSPAWMHRRQYCLSLSDVQHETSLDTGPLEKIVEEGKGIFTKRFVLQLKHIGRHDCIWKIISSLDICKTKRSWFHVFFLLPRRHTIHPPLLSKSQA